MRRTNLTPLVTRGTTLAHGFCNVTQYVRPLVPRHHVRRKPRGGARLRGRRLPAANSAHRGRYPAVARQTTARAVALHHAAARAGYGEDPIGDVSRRERT